MALGVNAAGQVVGGSEIAVAATSLAGPSPAATEEDAPPQSHAFLWEDGVMTDLNNLVADDRDVVLETAIAITDAGQIVGVALVGDQHHLFNAFLLTPVV